MTGPSGALRPGGPVLSPAYAACRDLVAAASCREEKSMTGRVFILALLTAVLHGAGCAGVPMEARQEPAEQPENSRYRPTPPLPYSDAITGVRFDSDTVVRLAEGSDNWAVTWSDEESQFVTWGDGGGFGGADRIARVSMGVARLDGPFEDFTVQNVWGGKDALAEATFGGKSYGILAIGLDLWLWRSGSASDEAAFRRQELYVSHDDGRTFDPAGVSFTPDDFPDGRGFFVPTFLQFGPGYRGAIDEYVYVYAPENRSDVWAVQRPGEISLMRAPADQLADRAAWEFFSGLDSRGLPTWNADVARREPVFRDPGNGVMRTAVNYNAGLGRYLLVTQQRTVQRGGYIGIYESDAPWGPWRTVLFDDAWKVGLQEGYKSVYWNFSNKWTSEDGRRSALIYTGPGPDNFGVVVAEFEVVPNRKQRNEDAPERSRRVP